MSATPNKGDLLYQLVGAIREFASTEANLDWPSPVPSPEEAKQSRVILLKKVVRLDRDLDKRLNRVLAIAETTLDSWQADPNVVVPVKELALAASSIRDDVRKCRESLESPNSWRLFLASSKIKEALSGMSPRMAAITEQATNLISYYMLDRGMETDPG